MLDAGNWPHINADDLRDVLLRDLGTEEMKVPPAFCLLFAHFPSYKKVEYAKSKLFERGTTLLLFKVFITVVV